jgi:hypothetical protein
VLQKSITKTLDRQTVMGFKRDLHTKVVPFLRLWNQGALQFDGHATVSKDWQRYMGSANSLILHENRACFRKQACYVALRRSILEL